MKINFSLIIICVLLFVSCQKEISFDTSGGTTTPPSSSGTCNTYFPLSTGDTWTYDISGTTQVNTVITPDTTINGQVFKRITQMEGGVASTTFFREDNNGNVYGFADLGLLGVGSGQVIINPIRSNASVGDVWNDTIAVNGFTEKFEYKLMEKNISYQVDTFHFTNVQHVLYKVYLDFPPLFSDELVQVTDFWYAKCIGGIETKNQSIASGIPVSTTDQKIKSYTIY